tara:strand:- start:9807 stop:10580 length:774 start_codon:yes stop_codon:yes gene_type:complete
MVNSNKYKTVFLSDIHLGFNGCQSDRLKNFLDNIEAERIFLVGDIVDLWSMKENFFWPKSHQIILDKFISLQRSGTKIKYISGNHDDPLRDEALTKSLGEGDYPYKGIISALKSFSPSESYVLKNKIHGNILVIHGDQYDVVTSNAKWVSKLGGIIYDGLISLNRPLSKYLKRLTKNIVNEAGNFQKLVENECKRGGYDGLMCGHIHKPEIRKFENYSYLNTGDWIESCTAIVEDENEGLSLIEFDKNNTVKIIKSL